MQFLRWAERWGRGALGAVAGLSLMFAIPAAYAAGDAQDGVVEEKPRVAFVIGNDSYTGIPALENAVGDAKLVAASLRRLNFKVVEGFDLTLDDFKKIFIENKALIDSAEAVVFYYAGHAFQIEGQNYLVPVDAELNSALQIDGATVRLDSVVRELQDPDRPTMIFLDACRDNPLPQGMQLGNGLAQLEAGTNTFIAFATQPGNVSVDGVGSHSPFATALAKHLETPGLSIADLVIEVRNETLALTLQQQEPWDQSSLRSQFYFTERQRVNREKLFAAAGIIAANPAVAPTFQDDFDRYGFQPAVFRAAHRMVEIFEDKPENIPVPVRSLLEDPSSPPDVTIQLASTTPPTATADNGEAGASSNLKVEGDNEFSVLAALTFSKPGEEAVAPNEATERARRRELARKMQTELQRIGCYRMRIDGDWGPGSRQAFRDFLSGTKQTSDTIEPTPAGLNRLLGQSGRVCRAPVKYTPRKTTPTTTRKKVASTGNASRQRVRKSTRRTNSAKVQSFKRRAVKGNTRKAKQARRTQRKNALPPDLAAGIGIGM